MSLASALLKRLFVCRALSLPWSAVRLARRGDPKNGKPCAVDAESGEPLPIDFNVSHQAGLVALVGTTTKGLRLGVDVVWVNERNDYRTIDEEGFESWVETYKEVFSDEEVWDMKFNADTFKLLDGTEVTPEELGRNDRCCVRGRQLSVQLKTGETRTFSSDLLIDAKLRRFYTFWCYKEAYIKLTGEALLATWIPQLEFRNVRSPRAGTVARCSTTGVWGERVDDAEVWFNGDILDDVRLEIQAFEEDGMIAVTARPKEKLLADRFPDFKVIDIERDILDKIKAET
jgi:4'-phosphopantetheinyl transferase